MKAVKIIWKVLTIVWAVLGFVGTIGLIAIVVDNDEDYAETIQESTTGLRKAARKKLHLDKYAVTG